MATELATPPVSSQRQLRWRRLKWWLSPLRLCSLIAIGVATTVFTAWCVALLTPAPPLGVRAANPGLNARYVWRTTHLGFGSAYFMVQRGGTGDETVEAPPPIAPAIMPGKLELVTPKINTGPWAGGMTTVDEVRTHVYGWPYPSMRWWSDYPPPTGMSQGFMPIMDQPIDRHGGWEIAAGTSTRDAKMLPLSIYVKGFVFDALFWMVICVVSVEGVAAVRRARVAGIAKKRGLCVHCGYDRAGLRAGVVCPECGKA